MGGHHPAARIRGTRLPRGAVRYRGTRARRALSRRSALPARAIRRRRTRARKGHRRTLALGLLALIQIESQRYDEARSVVREGVELLYRSRSETHADSGVLLIASALVDLEREERESARTALERATALLPAAKPVSWLVILLGIWTGRVAVALDDVDRAELLLGRAHRELALFPDSGMLGTWLAREQRALEAARGGASSLAEPLTEAELRVLQLVPTHLTAEEIGRSLCISRNTVKTHLRVIYSKLSVSTRGAAVARAQAIGLLDPRTAHTERHL